MEQDKADAMVEDLTVLLGFRANSKNPDRYRIIGNYLAVEPFAIMLRKDEPALKTVADRTMGTLMRSGELEQLHHKWFESAIAPSNASMAIPIGVLMKDMIKYPTDQANAFP